jgi:ADP-heptose:LPS heptosyltransferase
LNEEVSGETGAPVPQSGDRVLWVRFWAFGDAIETAADAFNFKRRFPDTRLTFLSHPEYTDLLRIQPYIDDVIGGRKKPFAEWRRTLEKIRSGNYKWFVSDQRGGHTAALAALSGAAYRVGSASLFPFTYCYNIAPDWFRLSGIDISDRSLPSIVPDEGDVQAARLLLEDLPERRLFLLIGAGNDGTQKMWPAERWAEFLRPLADDGWGIVINGFGPAEENIAAYIESALPRENISNLVSKLSFRVNAAVAGLCSIAVGNDTGLTHLAALVGIPTIGLFSRSTSRSRGLRMPWFREICAADFVNAKKGEIPLKLLPAEPVARAFGEFAAAHGLS